MSLDHLKENVSRETLDTLNNFEALLKEGSQKMNLVSRETLPDIWNRHIWDSYQLFPLIQNTTRSIVDLGTGAGFPGLILSIAGLPYVTCIEKSIKKSLFLMHVIKSLNLTAKVINASIEDISYEPYDIIVSRACAPLIKLLNFSLSFTHKTSQCIFLKGENWQPDVIEAQKMFSFDYEAIPSLTHNKARVLIVTKVRKIL